MKTKNVFCANCQEVKPHEISLSSVGEFVFTCDCGRFIKVAGDLSVKEVNEALDKHEEANKGQISVEAAEQKLGELIDSLDEEIVEE
jgi:hypothetical protein